MIGALDPLLTARHVVVHVGVLSLAALEGRIEVDERELLAILGYVDARLRRQYLLELADASQVDLAALREAHVEADYETALLERTFVHGHALVQHTLDVIRPDKLAFNWAGIYNNK